MTAYLNYCYRDKKTKEGVIIVTITRAVQEILERDLFLQEAINREIISYNLLAKHLKEKIEAELGKKIKLSAIVMALRRNAEKMQKNFRKPSFNYYIETIKTDICYFVFEGSPTLLSKIQKLYSIVDFKKGGILNIIQGNFETSIIINRRYKEKLLDMLYDEKLLESVDDLVSISLIYSKEFLFTPGALYNVLKFVAWENINVLDIILTSTEMSLIVNERDLMVCFKTLGRFAKDVVRDI